MLYAKGIEKYYGPLHVLKSIDLTIPKGEIISIVGSSGAGKSSLLHILGTLDYPDRGELFFEGRNLSTLTKKELASFRNRHMGFVFQFHHLLPEFTALENVCIPGWISGEDTKQVEERAKKLLNRLGISDRADNKPNAMSGGEQQRVAVARALVNNPDIIFADEPTGNLDSANASALHQLFRELKEESGQTFVIVTHNEELASMSDRILHLKDGSWGA